MVELPPEKVRELKIYLLIIAACCLLWFIGFVSTLCRGDYGEFSVIAAIGAAGAVVLYFTIFRKSGKSDEGD